MNNGDQLNKAIERWANEKISRTRVRPRFGYYRIVSENNEVKYERPGFFEAIGYLLEDAGIRRSFFRKQKVDPNFAWMTTPQGKDQFIKFLLKMVDKSIEQKAPVDIQPSGNRALILPEFGWLGQIQCGDPFGFAFTPADIEAAKVRGNGFIGTKEWHPKMTLEDYYDAKEAGVNYLGAFQDGEKIDCFLLK